MITRSSPKRRDAAPGASWANLRPAGAILAEHHARYLEERGVTLEVAKAAGYWTARRPSEIPPAFSSWQRRRHPTLIATHYSPDGETVNWQKHDDRPWKDPKTGKPVKWISPKAESARPVLSVHPWMLEEVRNGTEPLWACEGLTRGHALAPLGIAAVTYAGCYSWQKDGDPLPCWDHVNLAGRLVYDVPDADAQTNCQVQDMLAARVRYLESRGARVLVVSAPEVNGDEHAGLDDYIAAGGDPEALIRVARPFVPVDVGRERLKRNERLRLFQAAKRDELEELPAHKVGECGAVKVARYIVEVSIPAHGRIRGRGVVVHPSHRQIAAGVRMGVGAVGNALKLLEAASFLKSLDEPRPRHAAASYLLLDPSWGGSRLGEHKEERGAAGKESQEYRADGETPLYQRESSSCVHSTYTNKKNEKDAEKLPALRNSKLVHTWGRRNGRRVVVHSDYFKRYGAKGEEILRHILEQGRVDITSLRDKFGSRTSRVGGFFKTWVKPMLDDGVVVGDAGSVEASPNWLAALERVQARTDEQLDNRLQDIKIADQQRAFRQAKDLPTDRTPDLAGPERTAEIVEAAEKRDHAARVEEQRRKVGTTPETFLADALEGNSGFGWRELRALWKAKGGKPEDLRRAVKGPYRFRREHDTGPLYVERTGATPEPESKPVTVTVLHEPENLTKPHISLATPIPPNLKKPETETPPGDWRSHPLDCECPGCAAPMPTYARARSGA
jgi:hypothetical protein